MKNTLLFLLFLLSNITLFAQEPLYVLYDPGCLKEYFYRLDGSKLYSDFNDYHLQVNDSTKIVFTVMRVENNRQTVKQLPSKYFGCSNRNITAADIKAVNEAKRPAYLVEFTPTGYAQSIINEISVYILTQEHLRYKTATYDMTYAFTGNYQGGDVLGKPNDAVPVLYSGSPMVECKTGVSYRENWFSEKETSSDITFFSELGMYSKAATEKSYQLMLIANTPIGEYLRNMCLTGETVFNPNYRKEVATIGSNPWNTDANPADNNGGTAAPAAPTYEMPDVHIVQAKESLYDIANYYPNLTVEKLREWNNLQTDVLKKGQEIRLKPTGSEAVVPEQPQVTPAMEGQVGEDGYYIVAQGDNLYKIAKTFGVTAKEIMIANNMTSQNIDLGQKLLIPGANGYTTKPEPSQPVTDPTDVSNPSSPVSNDPGIYVVTASNESLYDIAATYGVTANDLINWNDLNSFQLTPGQKLKVVNPDSKAPTTPTVVTPVVETPKPEVKPTVPTVLPATPTAVPTGGGPDDYHFVEMGENLAGIAKKHGITLLNIMIWNNLTDTRISAGQKLLIKDPATIKNTTPTTPQAPASGIHIVQDGDTYESVTALYNLEDASLIRWNELKDTKLVPGQSLYVKDPATITFAPPTPPATQTPTTHKVQKGEGLFAIARKYGITIAELRRLNNLEPDSVIKEGQDLIVAESANVKPIEPVKPTIPEKQPEPTKVEDAKPVFHTVKKGEGLYGIARKYNTTPENIMKLNNMKNNVISEEQKLRVK